VTTHTYNSRGRVSSICAPSESVTYIGSDADDGLPGPDDTPPDEPHIVG
jgi:hypothetical protein